MRKTGSVLAKTTGGLLIAVFLIFQLKGCTAVVWGPWKELRRFGVVGVDERTLDIYFFPDWHAVFWYTDPSRGVVEGALAQLRGTVGTHYVGRLWHIEGPGITLGYRLYAPGCEPVVMEVDTVAYYRVGPGNPTFPKAKKRTYPVFVFCPDRIIFEGMELHPAGSNPDEARSLRELLERSSEKQ